jgi:hypothetical protein
MSEELWNLVDKAVDFAHARGCCGPAGTAAVLVYRSKATGRFHHGWNCPIDPSVVEPLVIVSRWDTNVICDPWA